MRQHCLDEASEAPILCSIGRSGVAMSPLPAATPTLKDERIRAIVALAPTGSLLTAESLAAVRPATMIYVAELDRFLVPRFDAEWGAKNLPAPNLHRVPNAWHFAFMDTPSMALPSPSGLQCCVDRLNPPVLAVIQFDDVAQRHRARHVFEQDQLLACAGYRVLRFRHVPDIDEVQRAVQSTFQLELDPIG